LASHQTYQTLGVTRIGMKRGKVASVPKMAAFLDLVQVLMFWPGFRFADARLSQQFIGLRVAAGKGVIGDRIRYRGPITVVCSKDTARA
jgi:hypothetical protein